MHQRTPKHHLKLSAFIPLIVATALAAACMLYFKLPERGLLWSELQNSGHFVVFLGLTLLYLVVATRAMPNNKTTIIIGTILILGTVGVAIELIQLTQADRNTSVADIFRNLAGTGAGICLHLAFTSNRWLTRLFLILTVLLVTALVNKTSLTLLGYQLLKSGHPYIVNFDDRFVESNISVVGGADIAVVSRLPGNSTSPEKALQINFDNQNYSGVRFHETGAPWAPAETLVFEIDNPEDNPQEIHFRIQDTRHDNTYGDRFNTIFTLLPGPNTIPISVSSVRNLGSTENVRKMDLENISEIQIFSTRKIHHSLVVTSMHRTQ